MKTVLILVVVTALVVLLAPSASGARLPRSGAPVDRLARFRSRAPGAKGREQRQSVRHAIEISTGLAAAVEAGLAPRAALPEVVADLQSDPGSVDHRLLNEAAAAARAGNDVGEVLLGSDRAHWRAVGVAWRVGEESGAAFAPVLDRVSCSLRTDERIAREARGALATAQATSKLLAVLPLGGIALGRAIGGDTLGFLFTTPAGVGCVVVGLLFEVAGLLWVRSLMRKAEGVR